LCLAEAYRQSDVAGFHDWFYQQEHEPPARWPETYDRMPLEALPPCARRLLVAPNEAFLKPAAIRHLVRVMLALAWHPRHIAGLIRSKYERDYGWGAQFLQYDAATRADFYVRPFAGLVVTGRDDHLPPGQGTIDWKWLFGQLQRIGFGGAVILELASRDDAQQILGAARAARRHLRDISRQTELSDS
jgi:hypothetical protein